MNQIEMQITDNNESVWDKIMFIYESALEVMNTKLKILDREFGMNHSYNPIEHLNSRIKSRDSIIDKMHRYGKEVTYENLVKYINDVAGIRIICAFTPDIYSLAEMIASQENIKVLTVKDYIARPKPNGYMSYHMIVSVPVYFSDRVVDTKVEIQIRTIAMDFWASLEHKINYKFDGDTPASFKRELKECADIAAFLDRKMETLRREVRYYRPDVQNGTDGEGSNGKDERPETVMAALFGEVANG